MRADRMIQLNIQKKFLGSTSYPSSMLSHSFSLPPVALCTRLLYWVMKKNHYVDLLSTTLQAHIPTCTQVQVQDCREMQSFNIWKLIHCLKLIAKTSPNFPDSIIIFQLLLPSTAHNWFPHPLNLDCLCDFLWLKTISNTDTISVPNLSLKWPCMISLYQNSATSKKMSPGWPAGRWE